MEQLRGSLFSPAKLFVVFHAYSPRQSELPSTENGCRAWQAQIYGRQSRFRSTFQIPTTAAKSFQVEIVNNKTSFRGRKDLSNGAFFQNPMKRRCSPWVHRPLSVEVWLAGGQSIKGCMVSLRAKDLMQLWASTHLSQVGAKGAVSKRRVAYNESHMQVVDFGERNRVLETAEGRKTALKPTRKNTIEHVLSFFFRVATAATVERQIFLLAFFIHLRHRAKANFATWRAIFKRFFFGLKACRNKMFWHTFGKVVSL